MPRKSVDSWNWIESAGMSGAIRYAWKNMRKAAADITRSTASRLRSKSPVGLDPTSGNDILAGSPLICSAFHLCA